MRLLLFTTAAACLVAGAALSQPPGGPGGPPGGAMRGAMCGTGGAAPPQPPQIFDNMDANKDGAIQREELEAAKSRDAGRPNPFDLNKDGKSDRTDMMMLTQAPGYTPCAPITIISHPPGAPDVPRPRECKIEGMSDKDFAGMDLNKDGKLSREEFLYDHEVTMQNMQKCMAPAASAGGPAGPQGAEAGYESARAFNGMDTNHDDGISREELAAAAARGKGRPSALDVNKDGTVDVEDFIIRSKEPGYVAPPPTKLTVHPPGAPAVLRARECKVDMPWEKNYELLDLNHDNKISRVEMEYEHQTTSINLEKCMAARR